MDTIIELRKLQHIKFLEKKAEEEKIFQEVKRKEQEELERLEILRREEEIRVKEINEKLDTIIIKLHKNIQDLMFVKEYIRGSIIIGSIYNSIKDNIDFLTEVKGIQEVTNTFPTLIETINNNNSLSFNLHNISVCEKRGVYDVKKYINKIMDLLGIDNSILDINLMDTSNDEEYARKLQEECNMYQNPMISTKRYSNNSRNNKNTFINSYTINGDNFNNDFF